MGWWLDLRMKTKLLVSFLAVIAIFVCGSTVTVIELQRLGDLQNVGAMRAADALAINEIKSNFHELSAMVADILINRNVQEIRKELTGDLEQVKKDLAKVNSLMDTPEEKADAARFTEAYTGYVTLIGREIELIAGGATSETPELKALDLQLDKARGTAFKLLEKIAKSLETEAVAADKHFDAVQRQTEIVAISAVVVAVVLALILVAMVTRSITAPLRRVVDTLALVAEGDMTVRADLARRDELGELGQGVNVMAGSLSAAFSAVAQSSSQVAAAASQLNAISEQIATGAEEVAAQAGTVATAGEEMAATSGDIAQNCQRAAESADRASQAATDGAGVIGDTLAIMGQIAERVQETAEAVRGLGDQSDRIGAIIGTIEDIADQTNLLALNAAIEAARAGEMGRGFAVVADEVRALAERTTKATREIGEMIKGIQTETRKAVSVMEEGLDQVKRGTEEAGRSGEALDRILAQIGELNSQVTQIAIAAEEQTATTSEISGNILQITEVVQHTARSAQESSTAACQLAGNAEDLQLMVNRFRIN